MVNVEKRDAEFQMYEGLKVYGENNKRIEFLTLTKNSETTSEIFKLFSNLLCEKLLYKGRFGSIDYFLVMVNHQHLHILIKKPYKKIDELKRLWGDIVLIKSPDMMIKTVRGDKTKKSDMFRLVTYIITQGDKHNTDDIIFKKSENWGIVKHEKRIKDDIEKPKTAQQLFAERKKIYGSIDDYYFIDGEFILISDYEKMKKEEFDINKESYELDEEKDQWIKGDL